jgi:methylmalonyl-CoA/ethylmalonyl-CoA epimerase
VEHGPEATVRLAHIGVAVAAIAAAAPVYRSLGLTPGEVDTVAPEGVRVAFLPAGEAAIELLESSAGSGTLERFLAKRGPGIHHVAFQVPDIRAALERARRAGARLIDQVPRSGAHGARVAFLHPASGHGALIELVEAPPKRVPVSLP